MKKPYKIFSKIGLLVEETEARDLSQIDILTKLIINHDISKRYKLSSDDIIIISRLWHKQVIKQDYSVDVFEILEVLFELVESQIENLDKIISLLEREILYISKKEIFFQAHSLSKKKIQIKFTKRALIEENLEFHHDFLEYVLEENEDIGKSNNTPYKDNREYLDDWFSYVEKIDDFTMDSFAGRSIDRKLDNCDENKVIEIVEWEHRISSRTQISTQVFPLLDLIEEYHLDENETKIIVYLVKEELENRKCFDEEIIKLISNDHLELYNNKSYISDSSKLVKHGLIEISEGAFFLSSSGSVRVATDIMRRIIMRNPINDEERLNQLLKDNDLFTLVDPAQTFNDLILPDKMKETISFSLTQYSEKVGDVLESWGLYDASLQNTMGKNKKKESGSLMLFYGAPGTGKTFAAGAIAKALNKKLLITDISRIQSKWVGDSEKNVRRIFTLFERIVQRVENPPVLLLNEADQFLAKRNSEANSSVDKMMNSMQNLFLEAFENLQGVLIATTNLRGNLDDAFSRRFNLKLDFPMPQVSERFKLWELHLPKTIPGLEEINVEILAKKYILSGGQIKIIIKNACIEAASRKGVFQKLLHSDLIKYCEIEVASAFGEVKSKSIGF